MVMKEEFTYDSRDNKSKIHAIRWIPQKGEIKGIVQIVHGMVEHIDRYDEFANFLAQQGIVVVGNDHLGHGASVAQDSDRGYFCKKAGETILVRDVHRLKKLTQKAFPGKPYFILGHSMGSFITRKYIVEYGKGIDGAIIMGTGSKQPYLLQIGIVLTKVISKFRGATYRSKLINNNAFGSFNKRFCPARTEHDWLTKDAQQVDIYEADERNKFIFTLNGYETLFKIFLYIQKEQNFTNARKDLPILFVSGTEDPVGDFSEGVKTAYAFLERVGYSNLDMKLYENDRHEILNETDKDVVYKDLGNWIMRQISDINNSNNL